MNIRLALRALLVRPVRSSVLACGFGLGVSVMASLLGIGEVILEQARSPALHGGGQLSIGGVFGTLPSARFVLANVLSTPPLDRYVETASPRASNTLYLVRDGVATPILAKGGIPSLERALDDAETAKIEAWTDAPRDATWLSPPPGDVLRAMDRFHPIPDVPHRADSWAEWLYFNGQAEEARFYLTFIVGRRADSGRRFAGVRLQLDRNGQMTSYVASEEIDEPALLANAPDVTIGRNTVRLDGTRYQIALDLTRQGDDPAGAPTRLTGEVVLDPEPGRSFPPFSIAGADGWVTGYTVPVLSGSIDGTLTVGDERVTLDGGRGYHDHNWGFWENVSWRWGQVQHEEVSFVYGRVYPPPDVADPERMPGFLIALGPNGLLGYSTRVTIEEFEDEDDPSLGRPQRIVVRGRSRQLDLTMDLDVEEAEVARIDNGAFGGDMDFLQLRVTYRVTGWIDGEPVEFTAPGAAETFRER